MNPRQIDKIKTLINLSSILNAQERVEWLGLLDLMNDKQLLELEKILNTARDYQKTAASVLPKPVMPLSSIKSVPPPPLHQSSNSGTGQANPPPSGFAKPSFSHILNLPKLGGLKNQPSSTSPQDNKSKHLPTGYLNPQEDYKSQQTKGYSGKVLDKFGAQLKEILAERELPPPEKSGPSASPNKPLPGSAPVKLPLKPGLVFGNLEDKDLDGEEKPTVINIQNSTVIFGQKNPPAARPPAAGGRIIYPLPVVPKPKPKPAVFKPVVVEDKPVQKPVAPKITAQAPKIIGPQPAKALEHPAKIIPPPAAAPRKISELAADRPQTFAFKDLGKIGQKPAAPTAAAGINFVKPTVDYLSGIKPQTEPLEKKLSSQPAVLPVLGSLQDVTALTAEVLHTELSGPVDLLRKLAKNYGFHPVLFSLEQSPVYKRYIKTGTKVLSGQTTFGELAAKPSDGYLSKAEFERFTDLLREVQAGEK